MNKPRWDIYENNKKTLAEKENFKELKTTYLPHTEKPKNLNFSENFYTKENKNHTQNFERRKRLNNEITKNSANSENEKRNFLINLTNEENLNFQNEGNLFNKKINFSATPNGSEKKIEKNPNVFFTEKENFEENLENEKKENSLNSSILNIEEFMKIDEELEEPDKNIFKETISNRTFQNDYIVEKSLKFPEEFFQLLNQNESENSFTGIFSELNLFYFINKNEINFWDYDKNLFENFKEIPNNIINVHFTIPKIGLFSEDINYIAIIVTTQEIFIILVRKNEDGKLNFIKSDFIMDIGDHYITAICSTSEGRVFLGSQNLNLYELDYSNNYSFFGFFKKTNKITHAKQNIFQKLTPFFLKDNSYIAKLQTDNTRKILYCLIYYTKSINLTHNIEENISHSVLIIYDLGSEGKSFKKIGELNEEIISDEFNKFHFRQKNEIGFIIKDIFPLNRKNSKFFHLIITTKNGFRAYISFNTEINNDPIDDEIDKLIKNKNQIIRNRPTMNYSLAIKIIPEIFNTNFLAEKSAEKFHKNLIKEKIFEKKMFFLDQKFLIFYKDELKKRSFLDILEFEENENKKINSPKEFYGNSEKEKNKKFSKISEGNSFENISNLINFDYRKDVIGLYKNFTSNKFHDFTLSNLYKKKEKNFEKFSDFLKIPGDKNFLDSENKISIDYMNRYCKNIFDNDEKYLVLTSSEIIFFEKIRPVDKLYKIILEYIEDDYEVNKVLSENLLGFVNDYGINETAYMLLVIFSNGYLKFEIYEENINNLNGADFNERKLNELKDEEFIKFNNNFNATNDNLNINYIKKTIDNNEVIMDKAYFLYKKLINYEQIFLRNEEEENLQENEKQKNYENFYMKDTNNIGRPINEKQEKKINHIKYSLFIYISRISRIFWESNFFKFQNSTESENQKLESTFSFNQLENIFLLIFQFKEILLKTKYEIIKTSSEFELKIENYLKKNKNFAKNFHKNSKINHLIDSIISYEYPNMKEDFEKIENFLNILLESINFANFLYEFPNFKNFLLNLPKEILYRILTFKFKDLIYRERNITLKKIINFYFEFAMKNLDEKTVSNKIDELFCICPKIFSEGQKEILTAEILLKSSQEKSTNQIARNNMVNKAICLMIENPENVKIEYALKVLGEKVKVIDIIKICVKKSSYLKNFLDKRKFKADVIKKNFKEITADNEKENFDNNKNKNNKTNFNTFNTNYNTVNTFDYFAFDKFENNFDTQKNFFKEDSEEKNFFSKVFCGNFFKKTNLNLNKNSIAEIYLEKTPYEIDELDNKIFFENEFYFREYKKCIFIIIKFLDEIFYSIKNFENLEKIKKRKADNLININPEETFSDFLYGNMENLIQKYKKKNNFSILALMKKRFFKFFKGENENENENEDENEKFNSYDIQEELIGNIIHDIIYKKIGDFSLEQFTALQELLIEEILNFHENKYLHVMVFDHLKSKGMLELVFKFKSPYLEDYLKKSEMEEEDYSELRTNINLVNFYMNNKDYTNAFNILCQLSFQENKLSKEVNKNTNFDLIDLKRRLEFLKRANYVLEKLLNLQTNEVQNNFYLNFKQNISEKLANLEIQYEIRNYILNILKARKQIRPNDNYEEFEKIVDNLDYHIFDIFNLYYKFANKFKMHEIKILILFEQFKNANYFIHENSEIEEIYNSAINDVLNLIFVNYIRTHTNSDNFYSAEKNTQGENSIFKIIPLVKIIKIIQDSNWENLYRMKTIDFENCALEKVKKEENGFWFVIFMKEKMGLPINSIFNYFFELKFEESRLNLTTNFDLVFIVGKWCDRIEEYIERYNSQNENKISKDLYEDFVKFTENEEKIFKVFEDINIKLEENVFKVLKNIITDESIDFIKKTEERFNKIFEKVFTISNLANRNRFLFNDYNNVFNFNNRERDNNYNENDYDNIFRINNDPINNQIDLNVNQNNYNEIDFNFTEFNRNNIPEEEFNIQQNNLNENNERHRYALDNELYRDA